MASAYEFTYKNRKIFCLDLSGLKLSDKPKLIQLVEEAQSQIESYLPKSLLVITHVKNASFDTEIATILGDYASHNTPYVRASAVVGISGVQKVVLAAIRAITGREFYIAETMEEAQEWLVKQ